MNVATLNRTEEAHLVATRKLPDDLSLTEYGDLVDMIRALHRGASWAINPLMFDAVVAPRLPEARLVRAQYGSDWVLILSISGGITGILLSLAKVVREMTESANLQLSMGGFHTAEVRERNANAEKTEAETELLRVQIEERRRALETHDLDRELRAALSKALADHGFEAAAARLEPFKGPGAVASNGISRALIHAIRDLSIYDIQLSIEEE
ncbi:hypothetical protein DXT68_13395 [Microbacterium foliorum]|uniref:Uncharacterized protein n=1 Tax=Microbacterium foliorum TaxID=104336 RepID=A0A0F0KNB5_9MICO|nr:hypothetical protein [Microbacterium foliorum]AXL13025.1 hypothetical protein DXT68_13395 [Microbacterium foliorum]KJL22368.1 hypothetical protein RN50_01486 [Microbacterium foliorum]